MVEIDVSRLEQRQDIGGGIEIDQSRISPRDERIQPEFKQDYPVTREMSKIYRPTLEMGGMAVGGLFGTVAAPETVGASTIVGGTIGYAGGSIIADRLDEFFKIAEQQGFWEEAARSTEKLAEGVSYELGGPVIAKGVSLAAKGVWTLANKMGLTKLFKFIKQQFPSLSDKAILYRAKQQLEQMRELTPEAEITAKKTGEMLKRRGVVTEPTYAQKTENIQAGMFEQSVSAKDNQVAEILKGKDAHINEEVLKSINAQYPKGTGVQDLISGVEKQQATLISESQKVSITASEKLNQLRLSKGVQATGEEIKAALKVAKQTEKDAISEIYDQIPEGIELESKPIIEGLKNITRDFKTKGGGPDSLPSGIIKQMRKALKVKKGKSITFDNLRDWRSQIGEEKSEALMGASPNLKMHRRLKMLEDSVDDAMEQMNEVGSEDIRRLYMEASKRYKNYRTAFFKGEVGETLQYGRQAEGGKVPFSDIPSRFFRQGKMDAADDLIRAIGVEKASTLIDNYASNDLLARASDNGVLKTGTAISWLKSNKDVLNKYGLYKKYSEIIKLQQISDLAISNMNAYNKSIASKIIGVDADDVIRKLFSGQGKMRSAYIANELLNLPGIKGNPASIRGLQTSFKDFMLKQMESTKIDIMGNPVRTIAKAKTLIDEYLPAMKILYRKSPEKIQALKDYHYMLQMLARNKVISFTGGSTTAEKFSGTDAFRTIGKNIAQYIAVSAGKGWKFSVMRNLWSATLGAPRRWSDSQISALLTEAIYNPDVAKTIMEATKKLSNKNANKLVQQQFKNHLIAMGLYTVNESIR